MEETLIDTIRLENRLRLEIYDASRRIAGDRWQVRMLARVQIDLTGDLIPIGNGSDPSVQEMTDTLGDRVLFEYQAERNFVDETEKEAVLNAQKESFLVSARSYLGHPEFPGRYTVKKYREALNQRTLNGAG